MAWWRPWQLKRANEYSGCPCLKQISRDSPAQKDGSYGLFNGPSTTLGRTIEHGRSFQTVRSGNGAPDLNDPGRMSCSISE